MCICDLILLWPLLGIILHIAGINGEGYDMPPWRKFSTYLMFFPAMLAGPFTILAYLMEE